MEGQKSIWNGEGYIACMACYPFLPHAGHPAETAGKNSKARHCNENISLGEIVDANNQWTEP